MRRYRMFFLMLALAFLYCWIKFYTFYREGGQGIYGSSVKGDFVFYLELFVSFIPIGLFTGSIYSLIRVSKDDMRMNGLKLFLGLIFFIVAAGSGVFSVEEYSAGNSFGYLNNHYDDWRFLSDNFLMENLILFFVSGLLFIYKLLSNFIWKRK